MKRFNSQSNRNNQENCRLTSSNGQQITICCQQTKAYRMETLLVNGIRKAVICLLFSYEKKTFFLNRFSFELRHLFSNAIKNLQRYQHRTYFLFID